MTEPLVEIRPGHKWTRWKYSWPKRRWYRHCTRNCTGMESVPRGMKPKGQR